jgi:uncharacterized damage-inducible protein DinB
MTPLGFLRDDLARVVDGDAWHGGPLLMLLDGVGEADAAARPVPGAHSVWEIVLHLAAWMEVGARRLTARVALAMNEADDWPPVPDPPDASAWEDALGRLGRAQQALLAAVDALEESDLFEPLGPRDRAEGTGGTVAYLLAGLAQHAAYHGGQIAQLRKALGPGPAGSGGPAQSP